MLPIRYHHLKAVGRAPAFAKLILDGEEKAPTRAMEMGTGVHALLFKNKEVIAYPGATRRGKEWDAFKAEHAGAFILTGKELEVSRAMAKAIQANRLAMSVLDGEVEKTILFDIGGRACRTTPDVRGVDFVTELKSTVSSDPRRFTWQAQKMGYHGQNAWHLEGVLQSGLGTYRKAYVVAVESSAPFIVTVMQETDRALDQGARQCRLWFEQFRNCEATGEWPGYAQDIVPLDAPEDEPELIYPADEAEAA